MKMKKIYEDQRMSHALLFSCPVYVDSSRPQPITIRIFGRGLFGPQGRIIVHMELRWSGNAAASSGSQTGGFHDGEK